MFNTRVITHSPHSGMARLAIKMRNLRQFNICRQSKATGVAALKLKT